MVAELVALISTQGISIVIVAILLFGLMRGVPKLFSWLGKRVDEMIDIYKKFIEEQVQTMREIKNESKEIYESNKQLVEMVIDVTGKVDTIEESVEEMKEDIKVIKEIVIEKDR